MVFNLLFEIFSSAIKVVYMLHKGCHSKFSVEILSLREGHWITCTPGTIAFRFKYQSPPNILKQKHIIHTLYLN